MNDLDPARGPLSREEKSFFVVMLVIVGGFFVAELVSDFRPRKLAGVVPLFAWVPLLWLHTLGHTVAARLVGWKLGEIVVGQARPIGTFRRDTYWEFRLLPLFDFVRPVPAGVRGVRLKLAFVALAGAGIQLLFAGAIIGVFGIDAMFSPSEDFSVLVAQLIAATAAFQAAMQFLPVRGRTPEGELPSDGGWLLRAVTMPRAELERLGAWQYRESARRWQAK